MKISILPLKKAAKALRDALKERKTMLVRDATVKRFEFTFNLAVQMLQRYFKEVAPTSQSVEDVTYRDLCRLAAEAGLIDRPQDWFAYREARNITSHAYDESKAEAVYKAAGKFSTEVDRLIGRLDGRL